MHKGAKWKEDINKEINKVAWGTKQKRMNEEKGIKNNVERKEG